MEGILSFSGPDLFRDRMGGSYTAVATLRSTNFPMQERVAFELR